MALKKNFDVGNLKKTISACSLGLLAAGFTLLAPSPFVSRAWSEVPSCEDVGNDGKCDTSDPDITAVLEEQGFFSTSHSIIVSSPIRTKNLDVYLDAGNNITMNSSFVSNGLFGSLELYAGNDISLGDGARLIATQRLLMYAGGDMVFGVGSLLKIKYRYGNMSIFAGGDIEVMDSARLAANWGIDLIAIGEIDLHPGTVLRSPEGFMAIRADDSVHAQRCTLLGESIDVTTTGTFIEFQDSLARAGYIYFASEQSLESSTIDITGSIFTTDSLVLDADVVIQDPVN
jgi:hypothetical protein